MQPELKGFQSFHIKSLNDVNQLRRDLPKRLEQQSEKTLQYKQKWDDMSLPLMEAADHCNELRGLRSQIQKSECNLEAFNNITTVLARMTRGLELTSDQEGYNLFHYACWGNNLKLIQELLARGAQANLVDAEGNCIIHLAVENETQTTPEVLETLIKQPLFSKINSVLELKNKRGKTPLHVAATFGNLTAVQWIVGKSQKALDLEVDDNRRMTPLHYAAREGQEKVVNYLLTMGAGKSIKLADNNHPLVLAIQHERINIVRLFFKYGIWLIPQQIDCLQKIAEKSDNALSLAYCLAIPVMEGLNDLARLKPFLRVFNQNLVTAPNTPVVTVSSPSQTSSSPTTPITPLNVSSQGNNCGLFALVLGLKKALENKPELKTGAKLPDFFEAISTDWLKPASDSKETVEMGLQLRQEMAHALLQDTQYKTRRHLHVISVLREFLEGRQSALDMTPWLAVTMDYRENLKKDWVLIKHILEKNYSTVETEYRALLDHHLIRVEDIATLKEKLSQCCLDKPEPKILEGFLEPYCSQNSFSVFDLIRLRRLYRAAWEKVTVGTGLERNTVAEAMEGFFKRKTLEILEKSSREALPQNLLLLSFLEKTRFDKASMLSGKGIASTEEVLSTATALFVENNLIPHWDNIYRNYAEHLKTAAEMLSADELGALARYWQVGLKIQFATGEPYTTTELNNASLHVTLCNPSQIHWNVVSEGEQSGIQSEMPKIAALILGLENNEFKRTIIEAINNEKAYAQRADDCSYIVGVASSVQDIPFLLSQQGNALSPADCNTAQMLAHYLEQGLLKLNAEAVYGLKSALNAAVSSMSSILSTTEEPTDPQNSLLFDYDPGTRGRASATAMPATAVNTRTLGTSRAGL